MSIARHAMSGWMRMLLSIRARLLLLAIIAVTPLIGERMRGLEIGRADRIRLAEVQALDLARQGAAAQAEIVNSAQALLETLALTGAGLRASAKTCESALSALVRKIVWIDGLLVASPDGRVVCSNRSEMVGVDLSRRLYFNEALLAHTFVVSDYLKSYASGRPVIATALPALAPDGSVSAVLVATLDLDWIRQTIMALSRHSDRIAFVVDGTGTIVAHNPDAAVWAGQNVANHSLISEIRSRASGSVTAPGLDGVRRIFGFTRLDQTNSRLVVGINEHDVLYNINRQVVIAQVVLASVAVLVLLAVWFGGERLIVRPLRALTAKAVRFGEGRLFPDASVGIVPAEFMPLDAALNAMAAKLRDRESQLRAANRHLGQLARVDGLTGLANRRALDARLDAEWQAGMETGRPVALLMIDVDFFKRFNDRYGHTEGDLCLQTVAKTIAAALPRPVDFVARYGGEEFAILLPGAEIESARQTAERVRLAVQRLAIPHIESGLRQLTISVGVASMVPDRRTLPQQLVEKADAALYAAKRRGRNGVSIDAPSPVSLAS